MKIVMLLILLALPVLAQDSVKVSVSFANTDFAVDDLQGLQGEVDGKIVKAERFRLGGVFHYARPRLEGKYIADTYSAGPSLSYDVFNGRVSLVGRALFGTTTDYNGSHAFTRTYGAWVHVNAGHFFFPVGMDFVKVEGVPVTTNRVGAGLGLRF